MELKKNQTPTWPPTIEEKEESGFIDREVKGQPSTERNKRIKQRYLDARLMLDPEFSILFTEKWRECDGEPVLIRHAKAYAYALENVTPSILPDELIVMQKTRYTRGAPVHLQYSQQFYPIMLSHAESLEDKKIYDIGMGGGRKHIEIEGLKQCGIYAIKDEDVQPLLDACNYWKGKCIDESAEKFINENMPDAETFNNGYKVNMWPLSVVSIMEGRWVPAYDIIVNRGLEDVINECKEHIANTLPTTYDVAEKILFWRASIISCEAVINWAKNYAKKARENADTETDATRKKELLDISERLEWVPAKPARNFMEALQSAWIGHIAIGQDCSVVGLSPGRWGQLLYPYYKKDLEEEKLTRAQVIESMEQIRIKFSGNEYIAPRAWSAMASGNAYQHLVVGGVDKNGLPAENDLEFDILQAGINMQTIQPTLGVQVSSKTSNKLMMKAAECCKSGGGYPAFFNNDVSIQHLLIDESEEDITLEDARDVAIAGCVEIGTQGTSHGITHPAFFNEPKILEIVLNDGVDPRTNVRCYDHLGEIDSYEKLWDAWCKVESKYLKFYMDSWNYTVQMRREINPLVFASVLMKDCVKTGRPMDENGCRYNKSVTLLNSGMVNVANSFAAIKKCIFEKKLFTMDELKQSLKENFGYEKSDNRTSMLEQKRIDMKWAKIHKLCLDAPKFGNDDDYVDSIFVDLWQHYKDVVSNQTTYLGYHWVPAALSISSHGPFGRVCGATPDGRLAGVTLTDGILSATPGTDVNGPIALLNSGVKLDCTDMRSVQLNMKFHPNAVKGTEGSHHLVDLIRGYFSNGGYHIQFNIVDSKMLRDAQAHPENYRDLIVRVAGFSAYWVELGKPIQDEIIARTEYGTSV